jgi:integrase
MATYEYETKKGTKYGARGYLGIDELTGKQVNINKRGFDTRKEADVYFLREKLKFEDGERKEKAKAYTFQEVYEQWLEVYQNTVKESSLAKTMDNFRLHILPKFGDLIVSKIKPYYIQKVVNEWHKQFKMYRLLYNYFSLVMEYAKLHNFIKIDPCEKVSVPTKKLDYGITKTTKDFYDKEELQKFLSIVKEHESLKWYTMYRLFAFSGIRRGELLALTWNDINFKTNTLSISKTLSEGKGRRLVVQEPKSKAGIREISLDDITIQTLKEWRHKQAELLIGFGYNAIQAEQLIFTNNKDNGYLNLSAPRYNLSRICKKHNLEMINIHGFRHTHCSLLFEAGVPVKDVKERLGHSDIQTTMNIYTHVTKSSRKESAEKFAQYVNF